MIYNKEECDNLLLIRERKLMERSIYGAMEMVPIAVRMSMDCQLQLDIERCNAM